MAEWKTQVNYNYNPAFHSYTYGFMYQAGPEQNHGSSWSDNCEQNGYNAGPSPGHFPATRGREESPPRTPEQQPESGHFYQDSGVVYIREPQAGRLVLAGPQRVGYDSGENRTRRTGSDSASDSEAHTSPDSWSSGSNYERSVPQTDPTVWIKNEEETRASPDNSENVSSSLMDESQPFTVQDPGDANSSIHTPCTATTKQSSCAPNAPKAKVRAAFSESQMNTLVQRFNMQRYLTPAEMKNLADVTGLTYKQIKTWFQNRRMKLRRHQKDTSWVSERYAIKKDDTATNAAFTNMAPHVPSYQGDGTSHLRDHYNQHMMSTTFKNAPQNLAFYLAAMGSPTGTAAYPPWSSSPPQAPVTSRPQVPGWPLPPACSQFEFRPLSYNSAGAASLNTFVRNASLDGKEGESVGGLNAAILHNAVQ